MAAYVDLRNQFSNDALRNRVAVACVIAANDATSGTPTAAQLKFANYVYTNPDEVAKRVLMAVLATHKNLTVTQIEQVTDPDLQAAVNAVIPKLTSALFA